MNSPHIFTCYTCVIDPEIGDEYYPTDLQYVLYYARPWAADFLACLGEDFADAFPNREMKASSFIRTIKGQELLSRRNVNAATAPGLLSGHLRGFSLDLSRKEHTSDEQRWLRERFRQLEKARQIIWWEENITNSFHVTVSPKYWSCRRDPFVPLN